MIAQYTGITFGLSIAGAVFVNEGLNDLKRILPDFPQDQLSSILSGKFIHICLSEVEALFQPELAECSTARHEKSLQQFEVDEA